MRIPRSNGSPSLVQVTRRRLDAGGASSTGFLLGASADFVLLQKFSAELTLDGYEILMARDIADVADEFPRREFYLRVLQRKSLSLRSPGDVVLTTPERLLTSIQALFPLLVVHEERIRPDEVMVGADGRSDTNRVPLPPDGSRSEMAGAGGVPPLLGADARGVRLRLREHARADG